MSTQRYCIKFFSLTKIHGNPTSKDWGEGSQGYFYNATFNCITPYTDLNAAYCEVARPWGNLQRIVEEYPI